MDFEELTWREQEILTLLAERLTNREIANHLHLAESTVKDYVSNILGKLYVKNRRQAVEKGKKLGLLGTTRHEKPVDRVRLPSFPSPFVGRHQEIKKIQLDLNKTRLLTISGPGGVGKTRLAIKIAKEIGDDFESGAFLISLAPIQHPDEIVQVISEALAFPLATSQEPVQQLIRYLQKRQLLLVIDNFEHVLEGVSVIEEILRYAPNVKILVTSRERLNLSGEVNYLVEGLTVPENIGVEEMPSSDAVDLFIQHAHRSRPSFKPSTHELGTIAAICKLVQGLPLAIELAAAWLNVLRLDEIRAEIEQSFDFLSGEMRAVPARHRSIRAIFEHTWAMLGSDDRDLFAQVSVFRGGFTRPAAQKIANANIAALSRLVNKSIIRYDPKTARYEVHELLRQYAHEHLKNQPELYQSALGSHAFYFAAFMEQKWSHLRDNRQIEALREIDADIENIRAAWRFHVEHANVGQIQKYLNSFWLVYWLHGWNLGAVQLFENAVKSLEDSQNQRLAVIVRAHAMANQAFFLAWLGQADKGYKLAIESIKILERLDDLGALYFAYHGLTLPAYYLGRLDEELNANLQMLKIAQFLEDKWLIAFGNFLLSVTILRTKDLQAAERLARISLADSKVIQDLTVQSMALNTLGHVTNWRGEYELAQAFYQMSLVAADKLGFRWGVGNVTKYLGQVALKMGELAKAEEYILRSLMIAYELGMERDLANLFFELARIRDSQDRKEEAVVIIGMLFELPESHQERLGRGRIIENAEQLLATLEGELSSRAILENLDRGRALDPTDFISALLRSEKDI